MIAPPNTRSSWRSLFLCLLTICSFTTAQVPQNPRPSDEVIRVYTELVQTDVMVFDKQGRFVNDLSRDSFQLKVDGKLQPIQAFDLIRAGSDEEVQLMAARGGTVNAGPPNPNRPVPLDRGRTVFFFLDDFHIDLGGFSAARKVMTDFVDKEMGQNDQVAITAASGQVGFLQQLTNNRTVLAQAIERLKPRTYSVRDGDRPPMSEYHALLIDNNDFDVFDFFVSETVRRNPAMTRDIAASIVRARVQSIQSQAALFNTNTLSSLDNLVRSLSAVPGRKVLFLLSNGFLIQNKRSDSLSRLQQITAAAAKSGVVIYSVDARGLAVEAGDITAEKPFDPSGRLQRADRGELFATQDVLNALARDTGGKPIFNTNDFRPGVTNAVKETSAYYLLAWKPDSDEQRPGRFRKIEVTVVGRPDLTVRVRRGFFDVDPPAPQTSTQQTEIAASKTIPKKLRDSIVAPFPQNDLPIILTTVYHDAVAKGPTISALVLIPGQFMTFGPQDEKIQAVIDIGGAFYNTSGEPTNNYLERIVTTAPNAEAAKTYRRDITYTFPSVVVKPGLYQVRVAARDEKSGRIGSAYGWVDIPDLTKKQLAMSSLLLAERTQAMMMNVSNANEIVPIAQSASRRFRRQSNLRFLLFAYNAELSTTGGKPDVAVQVQVVRDSQPVITTTLRKINTDGVTDLTRLPYAAEVSLTSLNPGQYVLQVTVIDRLSKQSTTQQTHFEVY